MIVRPYGIILDGVLEFGWELIIEGGVIREVRPHTGIPENYVVSPAFVNAHSHLEYRGMQGKMQATNYWDWIREITEFKKTESDVRVRQECIAAAHENKKTGVAVLAEHSDRPFAATAILSASAQAVIFQETITFFERDSTKEKLRQIRLKAMDQAKVLRKPVFLTPHAYHTVDRQTLADFGASNEPISIHVAETEHESELTERGEGPIADFYRRFAYEVEPTGKPIVPTLNDLGLVRPGAQFVHCCAISDSDIGLLAENQVSVAHCPRSNTRLKCPSAPVREMLSAGVKVGLGLDSPASSGQIDMFSEMREALRVSCDRSEPLTPEEVWSMATDKGAESLSFCTLGLPNWRIEPGSAVPLIKIQTPGATSTEELLMNASPAKVGWVH